MNILKCPECGKEFDDTKQACPNCGCPISLMATINSDRLSKYQNRMIALAKPIGILSLILALTEVSDLIRLSDVNISALWYSVITIFTGVVTITTFILLFVWFLSLYKGSVKNSKMRKTSAIAIVGIILFLVHGLITIIIDLYKDTVPDWLRGFVIIAFYFGLNYIFFGSAFCVLSKFFYGRLKTIVVFVGLGFLSIWFFSFTFILIDIDYFLIYLIEIISILCYLFLALFFFEFSKTNKS